MSSEPSCEPTQVDADALDLGPLLALLDGLASAAKRSAANPRPDDAIPLRHAAMRAGVEFVRIIPDTDWTGIGPCPAMAGRRTGAIHTIFRVLRACLGGRMPPPARIAGELRAVLTE